MSKSASIWAIILLLFLAIMGIWLYTMHQTITTLPYIDPQYKPIGVVNMAFDHPIKMKNVLAGVDVVVVINQQSPYYKMMKRIAQQQGTYSDNIRFELSLYDSNNDTIIDNQDPIWPSLQAIVFKDNGQHYDVKSMEQVGIRGILLTHVTPKGNHTVLLSDGSERILFQVGTPLKKQDQAASSSVIVNPKKLSDTGE